MAGSRVVIAAMKGLGVRADAHQGGVELGFGNVDAQDALGGERGHGRPLLSSQYGTLSAQGGAHTRRSTLCIQASAEREPAILFDLTCVTRTGGLIYTTGSVPRDADRFRAGVPPFSLEST